MLQTLRFSAATEATLQLCFSSLSYDRKKENIHCTAEEAEEAHPQPAHAQGVMRRDQPTACGVEPQSPRASISSLKLGFQTSWSTNLFP